MWRSCMSATRPQLGSPRASWRGFHRVTLSAASIADRHVHDHGTRALLFQHEGERMDPAQRSVLAIRRRLVRAHVASAAREAEGHEDDWRPLRRAGRARNCQPGATFTAKATFVNRRERANHGRRSCSSASRPAGPSSAWQRLESSRWRQDERDTVFPGDSSRGSRGRGQEPDGAALLEREPTTLAT